MAMSEELGREPTDEELADEVGISAAKLSQLRMVSIRPASLDAPMNDDDGTEFGEIVGDDNAVDPAENLCGQKPAGGSSPTCSACSTTRERKIIMSRFGLDGGKTRTLEEVGQKFGVTRERIRQLQNIALAKLRRALRKREHPIEHLISSKLDAEDIAAIAANN